MLINHGAIIRAKMFWLAFSYDQYWLDAFRQWLFNNWIIWIVIRTDFVPHKCPRHVSRLVFGRQKKNHKMTSIYSKWNEWMNERKRRETKRKHKIESLRSGLCVIYLGHGKCRTFDARIHASDAILSSSRCYCWGTFQINRSHWWYFGETDDTSFANVFASCFCWNGYC